MNLFISLKENKDLSKNERILANYILKHPEDVLKMSSKDLGKVLFLFQQQQFIVYVIN